MRTRIKICCISSVDEAKLAVRLGADALGLVGDMPSGPGVIDDELARDIAQSVPPPVATVLLTQRTDAAGIADHVSFCGTDTVQIVNHIDPAEYPRLLERLPPSVRAVQVVHVQSGDALDLIDAYSPFVDAFLLDSGRPGADTPELGGTGRVHDWRISAEFVRCSPKPVFLAGGLDAANVRAAMREVRPFGLDVCSSVRSNDKLSPSKLQRFMSVLSARAEPASNESGHQQLGQRHDQ